MSVKAHNANDYTAVGREIAEKAKFEGSCTVGSQDKRALAALLSGLPHGPIGPFTYTVEATHFQITIALTLEGTLVWNVREK